MQKLHNNILGSNRGFTIIELVFAIAILIIGVLGAAMMQVSAIKGNKMGNEITTATFLAQDKLEEIKNSTDITAETGGNDQPGIFTRSWQFGATIGDSRRVTVTVTWQEEGSTHRVDLTTITRGEGS